MTKEERVKQLKVCGQTIIDRAEDFIGDNNFVMGYKIIIEIEPAAIPEIILEKKIFPHKVADIK